MTHWKTQHTQESICDAFSLWAW